MRFKIDSRRKRTVVGLVIAIGLMLTGLFLSIYQHNRQEKNTRQVAHTYEVISQLQQIQALVVDVETSVRGFIITKQEGFLAPYRQALPRLKTGVATLEELIADNPTQQRRLEGLQTTLHAKLVAANEQIKLTQLGKQPTAILSPLMQGKHDMDQIRQQITQMILVEQRLMSERNQRVKLGYINTNWQAVLLVCLALVIIGLAYRQLTTELQFRQRAEQLAQQQADLLQDVVANLQVGIGLMEAVRDEKNAIVDFRYQLTNPMNAQITGRSVETLTGALMTHVLPGTIESGLLTNMIQVVESRECMRYELPYHYDGIDLTVDFSIAPQGDGVLFSALDISPVVQSRQALEQVNRELQRSNDSLHRFASIASHDLQEPLRKVQAFGDLLASQYGAELGETGIGLLKRSQQAAGRMSMLIRDLLQYSRAGRGKDRFAAVSLEAVVGQALSSLENLITTTGAGIHYQDLPTLWGDATQLEQLFQNLLSNALRYRQADQLPHIQITSRQVSMADLPTALLPSTRVGDSQAIHRLFWEISVADNGIGFDEKYLDRIFEIFQRLHGKGTYEGTGIGLANCQKVVQNHEGMLTARSQPGEGATFLIYLPA